jgi:tetratricopeptide (TPR) repeat protein
MNRALCILAFLTLQMAHGESAADKLTKAGIAEFTAACQAWDGTRFAAATKLFEQATSGSPATAASYYWVGVSEFHRMLQLRGSSSDNADADAAQNSALKALNTAVKLHGNPSESHAILGTLYGMKINGSTLRAAWFGPRVAKHREEALKLGPTNPRVRYLLGMCQFHTAKNAAEWREALTTLLAAEKLFEAEAKTNTSPLAPRWGNDSCLTFIGRTYELLGQRKEAMDYFRKALAVHPADHLAKDALKRLSEKS